MSTIEIPPQEAPTAPPPVQRPPSTGKTVLIAAVVSAVVAASVAAPLAGVLISDSTQTQEQTASGDNVAVEEQPAVQEQAGTAEQPSAETPAEGSVGGAANVVGEVAEKVSPSVVFIRVAGANGQGSGSGVIIREDGYILTNNHVVEGAAAVQVTLPDAGELDAEIVGTDPSSDLAVIKVDAEDLPAATIAEQSPRVGDVAVAIGSPFGLEGSVTAGIVSAVNRSLENDLLVDLIQTDAAINPGNSGGALANADAEVIGINTAIISPSQANAGIGFAIPIQTAMPIAEQLIEHGFVQHAQLGIQGQDIDPQVAELYGLGVDAGALVVLVVPGSAAEEAGLQRGDIITGIDDEPVSSMADLAGRIRRYSPGDGVTLNVYREGEEITMDVTFEAAPREP